MDIDATEDDHEPPSDPWRQRPSPREIVGPQSRPARTIEMPFDSDHLVVIFVPEPQAHHTRCRQTASVSHRDRACRIPAHATRRNRHERATVRNHDGDAGRRPGRTSTQPVDETFGGEFLAFSWCGVRSGDRTNEAPDHISWSGAYSCSPIWTRTRNLPITSSGNALVTLSIEALRAYGVELKRKKRPMYPAGFAQEPPGSTRIFGEYLGRGRIRTRADHTETMDEPHVIDISTPYGQPECEARAVVRHSVADIPPVSDRHAPLIFHPPASGADPAPGQPALVQA